MPATSQPARLALLVAVASLCLAFLLAAPAFAGKPGAGGGKPPKGGGGSATISLVLLQSTDGTAHYGQRITFKVTTTDPQPFVNLKCYQGGALVSQSTEGFFAGALDDGIFALYSPVWVAGAADCTADVKSATGSVIGSLPFHVYA
jgi:hypothetical protein